MPSPASSNSGDVTPKAAAPSLLPSFLSTGFPGSGTRHSTPPPLESPVPRTPKPRRTVNGPPRTPLAKAHVSFEESDIEEDVDAAMLHSGMAITRPNSTCSSYSCSSDSSVDSNTTYTTADGSCTSIEDEDGGYCPVDETPKRKPRDMDGYLLSAMPERQTMPGGRGKGKEPARSSGRKRKTKWTDAMDAHLWRTYALYQQDPKITPFFVLPGQVPPLGVCYKVARETKKSWKDAKLRGDYAPAAAATTPRPRTRQRTPVPAAETSNRGDAMRMGTPYTWTASESSTRRRLRELCRENYGPAAKNPYHFHQQQRGTAAGDDTGSRATSRIPPSLFGGPGGFTTPASRDAFSTTRNMALSLTTSTASSMRPTGALASLAAGRDVHMPARQVFQFGGQFGGIAERIASASTASEELQRNPLSTGPLGLGFEISSAFALKKTASGNGGSSSSSSSIIKRERSPVRRHHRQLSLDSNTPSLLPPLELKSSRSPYGTWPRRLNRAEDEEAEPAGPAPPAPRTRPRRKTLVDLFGDEKPSPIVAAATAAAAALPRTRTRGYTVSAGTNPLGTRRRPTTTPRPSAPLLTVTGPVSYEGDMSSPTTMRDAQFEGELDMGAGPRRLGSPFVERGRD
ncbi:hypothetical protein BZA05DRAFT_458085 [Tricharina praecox]|uniref:uncharacterized protein n=1 Tax=Tricharina praecox TaxID=43433 RepID=UPI002220C72A|nr:uncharacterized protein BZA05DRAFT_458085 [Tricharina praecox]KAI5846657.1 hypothetical protein BZA05DRAFT_458085 [Tricharina praecox]